MAEFIWSLINCLDDAKKFDKCASDSFRKLDSDVKKKIQAQFIDVAHSIDMVAYSEEKMAIFVLACFFAGLFIVIFIHCICMRKHPEKYSREYRENLRLRFRQQFRSPPPQYQVQQQNPGQQQYPSQPQ